MSLMENHIFCAVYHLYNNPTYPKTFQVLPQDIDVTYATLLVETMIPQ